MRKIVMIAMLLVSFAMIASDAFAHGGGLDGWGGHYVRTPRPGRIVGTYHFHRF